MKEKLLNGKKNGMLVLVLTIFFLIGSFALIILGAVNGTDEAPAPIFWVGLVLMTISWIPLPGLKVLKPQEALVLTLFGKYIGTLKGDGFYWVNPFSFSRAICLSAPGTSPKETACSLNISSQILEIVSYF